MTRFMLKVLAASGALVTTSAVAIGVPVGILNAEEEVIVDPGTPDVTPPVDPDKPTPPVDPDKPTPEPDKPAVKVRVTAYAAQGKKLNEDELNIFTEGQAYSINSTHMALLKNYFNIDSTQEANVIKGFKVTKKLWDEFTELTLIPQEGFEIEDINGSKVTELVSPKITLNVDVKPITDRFEEFYVDTRYNYQNKNLMAAETFYKMKNANSFKKRQILASTIKESNIPVLVDGWDYTLTTVGYESSYDTYAKIKLGMTITKKGTDILVDHTFIISGYRDVEQDVLWGATNVNNSTNPDTQNILLRKFLFKQLEDDYITERNKILSVLKPGQKIDDKSTIWNVTDINKVIDSLYVTHIGQAVFQATWKDPSSKPSLSYNLHLQFTSRGTNGSVTQYKQTATGGTLDLPQDMLFIANKSNEKFVTIKDVIADGYIPGVSKTKQTNKK